MNTYTLVVTILLVIVLVAALVFVAYILLKNYIFRNFKMLAVAETQATIDEQRFVINVYNANKNKDIWGAHESTVKWFAMNQEIAGVEIARSHDVPGALQARLPKEMTFQQLLFVTLSVKYNNIALSVDNGITRHKVISIPDSQLEKKKRVIDKKKGDSLPLKKEMIKDIEASDKIHYLNHEELYKNSGGVYIHVNEQKSTSTSLRYQMILPDGHPDGEGFVPEDFTLYYVFDGYAYEMETKYLGKLNDFYEWDIVNLRPNTMYVGLTFSVDHGKTLLPSSTFYGITRKENGILPILNEVDIHEPAADAKKFKMWTEKDAIADMGEHWANLHYKLIAKMHYEYYHEHDAYITVDNAESIFDEIKWLKKGKSTTAAKTTTKE